MSKIGSRKRAFTLIEILVVCGVLVLLAGLSFPVLSRVRENGRASVCSSNLKQLGAAFAQYRQDFGNRFPGGAQFQRWASGGHWVTGGTGGVPTNYTDYGLAKHESSSDFEWISPKEAYPEKGALYSYVKNASTYVCPSMRDRQKRLSYSLNCAIGGMSDIRIKAPNEIIMLVDEGRTLNDGYFYAVNDSGSTDSLTQVHNGGGNILFVDNHIKHYQFDQVPLDWNPDGLALKVALNGPVRFRDKSFGPKGAFQSIADRTGNVNSCSETVP